jgi:hypothetical protein
MIPIRWWLPRCNESGRALLVQCFPWQKQWVFSYGYIASGTDISKNKLGIGNIKEDALKDIQSKLSMSNITQELFSSFAVR